MQFAWLYFSVLTFEGLLSHFECSFSHPSRSWISLCKISSPQITSCWISSSLSALERSFLDPVSSVVRSTSKTEPRHSAFWDFSTKVWFIDCFLKWDLRRQSFWWISAQWMIILVFLSSSIFTWSRISNSSLPKYCLLLFISHEYDRRLVCSDTKLTTRRDS